MRLLSAKKRKKKDQAAGGGAHAKYFLIGRWVVTAVAVVSCVVLTQSMEMNFASQISFDDSETTMPQTQQQRKRHNNNTAYNEFGHNNSTNRTKTIQSSTLKNFISQPQQQQPEPPKAKRTNRFRITNHGLGVDLRQVAKSFMEAKQGGNDFAIDVTKDGWHYARGVCPKQDLSCFFESMNITEGKIEELQKLAMNKSLMDWYNPDIKQVYGVILNSMTIPLPEIKYEIDKQLPKQPTLPCGVIHVRHSDTILNFGWGNRSEIPILKYLSLGKHLEELKKLPESAGIKDIVLLTDDQNVIDDCEKNYQGDGIRWHYLKKKRWRGSEGGWENHFPSGNRRQEMVDILTEREMVANCSVWVGTQSSYGYLFQRYMKHFGTLRILQNKNTPKPKT